LFFNNLANMSHRIKRFVAFAILALFYHFAARGLNFGASVDTKSVNATTGSSLSDDVNLVSTSPGHRPRNLIREHREIGQLAGAGATQLDFETK
jgi:hypothetical protein